MKNIKLILLALLISTSASADWRTPYGTSQRSTQVQPSNSYFESNQQQYSQPVYQQYNQPGYQRPSYQYLPSTTDTYNDYDSSGSNWWEQ